MGTWSEEERMSKPSYSSSWKGVVKAAGELQAWPAQMAISMNGCPVSLHACLSQMAAYDQSSHTQRYPAGGAREHALNCNLSCP